MDAFIWPSAEKTECWMACPNITRKKIAQHSKVLWESCMSCSSAETDLCLTIQCQLVQWSIANITVHSCRMRWVWFFTVHNQSCLSMVSFCFTTMQRLITIVMCKIWCYVEAGRCWNILLTPQTWPHVNACCLQVWKNIFGVNYLNREDDINNAVTVSLHCLSKDKCTAATDCLPHRWEKCVDNCGDCIERRI